MAPLGGLSNFTLEHRAGYSCYVRAAYCGDKSDPNDVSTWDVVISDRIEGAINLGDNAVRSLKEAGIPDGATVQLVVEMVAAGRPMLFSAESWTYLEDSFRTATYKVSGTVFNPKLERVVRRRPPPPPPPMEFTSEKSPLLSHMKGSSDEGLEAKEMYSQEGPNDQAKTGFCSSSTLCCLFCR